MELGGDLAIRHATMIQALDNQGLVFVGELCLGLELCRGMVAMCFATMLDFEGPLTRTIDQRRLGCTLLWAVSLGGRRVA